MDSTASSVGQDELQYPFRRPSAVQVPPVYEELRAQCPVAKVRLPSGDEGYVVSRHEDVRAVLGDARFSRAATVEPDAPKLTNLPPMPASLFTMDPPEHTRLRRLVSREFTARRVENLRPRIQELTDELLDEMEKMDGPVDLNTVFAFPLPVMVICELLGVPFEDRDKFRGWSDAFVSLTSMSPEEMNTNRMELFGYLGQLVQRKREEPGDDLMSALVNAHDEEGSLSEMELIVMGITLLVAGHETTVSMIGTCVLTLLRHPEHTAALRERPELMVHAVEELMRINPIGDGGPYRITLEDVEIGGTLIPKNSGVIAATSSANRDADRFTDGDPDTFDPTRPSATGHLALGHGAHFCLGAALARAELQITLSTLLRRFPDLALADDVDNLRMTTGMMVHGLERLPVTW
ncbi:MULTISPECIES: cytochrome P450 [unclassified Streptomyces]|uniref:cytochrome P450 n=1 Tax=unclassified Streptomyces TaxID=2593676 RepID=UPI002553BBAC|nr:MULTISPECIES: cytochrome P450 [unclassified Streptomyces]WRZ66391.1 cytochrome P450 [Streptomyces sp. NBC_01257]WSU60385.1 cytochrome P450 [Streptomyces sp. NBC_01104]